MIDKVSVTDPGLNWDWLWYTGVAILGVLGLALLFWVLSFAMTTRKGVTDSRHIACILLVSAAIATPVGAGINACMSSTLRNNQIIEEKDRQIEELGYLNLDKENDYYQYTAVKDNEYVRIAIIEHPTLTWHIVPLDPSEEKK